MRKTFNVILVTFLVLAAGLACFSFNATANEDGASGQVSILNSAPEIGTVTLFNQEGADAAITLSPGGTVTVIANTTVSDINGGTDISTASGTLYHNTVASGDGNDKNTHITNSSCALAPSGNNAVVTCTFTMNFMALDGIWTANITAIDSNSSQVSGIDSDGNTVNSLAGLMVVEDTIDFGPLQLAANSTSGADMTVRSQGNVVIDAKYSGINFTCTPGDGIIPVGNVRYGLSDVSYDGMSTDLTIVGEAETQGTFDLGIQGVATGDDASSEKPEYWTIKIPDTGVSGTCTNALLVTAIESA
jgi:hypothetical protein